MRKAICSTILILFFQAAFVCSANDNSFFAARREALMKRIEDRDENGGQDGVLGSSEQER